MKTTKSSGKKEPMLQTAYGQTYWNHEGAYQRYYDKLYAELVPESGVAKTLHGELLRAAWCLSYEYFNNGNVNAYIRKTHSIDADGMDNFCAPHIHPRYKAYINLLKRYLGALGNSPLALLDEIHDLLSEECGSYDADEIYTHLMDYTMYYILHFPNKETPNDYLYILQCGQN